MEELLGSGGFGAVWRAYDTKLDRYVALKIPRRGELTDSEEDQFVREARAAAQLSHPHIVNVLEVGKSDETVYIATDLIEGHTLSDKLQQGPLLPQRAAEICKTIAEALNAAHEAGVVHRDLKPSNILLNERGDPFVADFGLAKRSSGEVTMTTAGQLLGSPAFMPPEQASGHAHQADARSDIYSLGAVLYQMLVGEPCFHGTVQSLIHQAIHVEPTRPRLLNRNIPVELETICLKCLEKQPERRYQTALDLANDLQRFLAGKPIVARRIGPLGRAGKWCRRNKAVATLLSLLALSIVLGFVGVTWQAVRALNSKRLAEDSANRTERVLEVLIHSFRSPDPRIDGRNVKVVDVLMKAASDLEDEFEEDPLLKGKLLNSIGESMQSLRIYDQGVSREASAGHRSSA